MFSFSKFTHGYDKSVFKYVEPISEDYKVIVNGVEAPVYTCRESKYPFNCWWKGHQRQIDQTELASFVNLVSDEEIKIEVIPAKAYKKVMIKPYSKGVSYIEADGKISFTIKAHGTYVLQLDDYHNALYIFNSKPYRCENPKDVTHYFGAGIHMAGKITLKDGESVYVDKDALVFGCIFAEGAKGIRVFGNGILDDSGEERFCEHCYEPYTNGNVKFYDCSDMKLEGVLLRNSAIWCVNLFHCFHADISDIKVFGQWRYNTDGVDIVNCQNITLKDSFIHSFDDSVTIKGIDRYISTDCKNIKVSDCTLMCEWGRACEIGLETSCREYSDIAFRNCDILRGAHVALDIQNGDCAEVHDVVFENIHVELESFFTAGEIQRNDEDEYTRKDRYAGTTLISIANDRFRACYSHIEGMDTLGDIYDVDLSGINAGSVRDILYKNIYVYYDEMIPSIEGKPNMRIHITSKGMPSAKYRGIVIDGITVNGMIVSLEMLPITTDCREAIEFK